MEAEKDQYDQTRIQMGLTDELFEYPLEADAEFTAPEVILSYTNRGLSRLSQQYHHCIMNHICRGKYVHANRPVLINSWEAAYFDFTGDTIAELAKQAKELGIDMVVMDDGWFGKRNDDNSSLGDWYVNEEKLGGTLSDLIKRVNAEGVKFGIWIEPEMVNEDSNLYRNHPDWAITIPGRNPVRSRNQLLLDFSRKEVRDEIFRQICEMLDQGNIEYTAVTRKFLLKAAAEEVEDLMQVCCIILLRFGAVTIQMPSIVPGFSMVHPSFIRWLQCPEHLDMN